jgi:hypothetical protein
MISRSATFSRLGFGHPDWPLVFKVPVRRCEPTPHEFAITFEPFLTFNPQTTRYDEIQAKLLMVSHQVAQFFPPLVIQIVFIYLETPQ